MQTPLRLTIILQKAEQCTQQYSTTTTPSQSVLEDRLSMPYDEGNSQSYHNIRWDYEKLEKRQLTQKILKFSVNADLPAHKSMYKWSVRCAWLINLLRGEKTVNTRMYVAPPRKKKSVFVHNRRNH